MTDTKEEATVPNEESPVKEGSAEVVKADSSQDAGGAAAVAADEDDAGGASEAPAGGGLQPEPEEPEEEAPPPVQKRPSKPKAKASGGRGGGGGGGGPKKKARKSDEQSGATKLHRFEPGMAVLGRYPDGRWYPAVVRELRADGRYLVDWDDGDVSNRVKDDDDLDEVPEEEY